MVSIIIATAITMIIYFNLKNYLYNKALFENEIKTQLIKVEYLNRGGYRYIYHNDYFWGTSFSESNVPILAIGDSIYKASTSLKLDIFRKDIKIFIGI